MNSVSPLKTMYIRKDKPSGSDITLVYQVDYANRKLDYSIAKCRKGDSFTRKGGRHIALSRFEQGKSTSLSLDNGSDRYSDIEANLRTMRFYGE